MSDGEGFLRRWSRLKLVVNNPAPQPVIEDEEPEPPPAVEASSYSALLRDDMPEDLRAEALRSLWRSEPSFGESDPMSDYGTDYHAPALVGEMVRSAWQAGRGYEEEKVEEVAEGEGEGE